MRDFGAILGEPVDLDRLLKRLDITGATLSDAAMTQGRLYMEASRFYVRNLQRNLRYKSLLKARMAERAQYFRKRLKAARQAAGKKDATESEVKELVSLSPSVQKLEVLQEKAQIATEWAELLLEAYKMRRDAIRTLVEIMGDEARSDLRIQKEQEEREELQKVQDELHRKYPGKNSD